MLKAYKYRIYPNKTQKILLAKTFGCVRLFWNKCVESFNKKENAKTSTELRNNIEFMKEVSAAAIQQKEIDFKATERQFFSKTRKTKICRPSFKSKRNKQSYRLPNQKFDVKDGKLRLEKIGWIRIVQDHKYEGKEISVTVSRDTCGDYFASVLVEEKEKEPFPKTNKKVGIDLGLEHLVTTSDGEVFDLPDNQWYLKHMQRRMSRKVKGSLMFKRIKFRIAKMHRNESRRRLYYLHSISKILVERYDEIRCEDLNVAGMMKNRCLAGAIQRSAWSELVRQIEYKAQWNGRTFVKVDRFFASSKTCSACGNVKKELKLSDRTYKCETCGIELDRDLNAARNIQSVGVDTAKQSAMGSKTGRALACMANPKDRMMV